MSLLYNVEVQVPLSVIEAALAGADAVSQNDPKRPILLTGSRRFGCAGEDSDWDFLVLGYAGNCEQLGMGGWHLGHSMGEEADFSSLKMNVGDSVVNLVVAHSGRYYDRFALASEVCARLGGPADKALRCMVFEAVIYGRLERPAPPLF